MLTENDLILSDRS